MNDIVLVLCFVFVSHMPPGNHLEGKTTAVPLRKAHGAAVYPLHNLLTGSQNGDQEERDIQMDVYV